MTTMTRSLLCGAALAVSSASAAPVVSNVTLAQPSGTRTVTVSYTLAGAPAIVTFDILTNCTATAAGASIGVENLVSVSGDVFKEIAEDGDHSFTWQPDVDWPGQRITDETVQAKVIARDVDDPPDYMVLETTLAPGATKYAVRYYDRIANVAVDEYRGAKLVMKRVHAPACGYYPMGNLSETGHRAEEYLHLVNLTEDYYLGVFELTKQQMANIFGSAFYGYFTAEKEFRPQENVTLTNYRGVMNGSDPTESSLLGKLRARTDYDFDLPSATQFEYALRAGNYEGYWPNGVAIDTVGATGTAWTDETNLLHLARFGQNAYPTPGGKDLTTTTPPAEGGTAIVGSYEPNSWGFYDMIGNVNEFCLDYYKANNSASDGHVATVAEADDTTKIEARGGCYWDQWYNSRPSRREAQVYGNPQNGTTGMRCCCPIARRK